MSTKTITVKKTLLVISLFFISIITINAQSSDNEKNEVQFGIKAGANLSKLKNTDGKAKIGMVAGFFSEIELSENFSLRSEVLFSVQGAKSKKGSDKISLNYINFLPLLGKFYLSESFSLEAGPQLGLLMSAKGKNVSKKNFKKLDYGVAVGAGFHITQNFEIGVRYNLGLRDITKTTGTAKNSVFQATLSYGF